MKRLGFPKLQIVVYIFVCICFQLPIVSQARDAQDESACEIILLSSAEKTQLIEDLSNFYVFLFQIQNVNGSNLAPETRQGLWHEKLLEASDGLGVSVDELIALVGDRVNRLLPGHLDVQSKYQVEADQVRSAQEVALREQREYVCGRTPQVVEALVIVTGKPCEQITNEDLARITELDLSKKEIPKLKSNDFKDMVYLKKVDLSFNQLTELPEGVFAGLKSLERLHLYENQLTENSKERARALKLHGVVVEL